MWIKLIFSVLALSICLIVIAIWYGKAAWNKFTTDLREELTSYNQGSQGYVSFDELVGLPEPVIKYFRHVLKEGQPIITTTRTAQKGGFRAKPGDAGWSEMKATQYFTSLKRGFIWDATITMAPLLDVRVCDTYIAGHARMKGRLLSFITVVDESGNHQLNSGALQRYLAESVWFPTSLLPGQGVKWEEIDENKARATLTDSGTTISLEFEFNDVGEVTGVFTSERYREVNGRYVLTPWKGRFSNYQEVNGYLIPFEGEVEWHLQEGTYPYWKAALVKVEYGI